MSALPQNRTLMGASGMSAKCQKRTSCEINSDNRLSLPERPITALVRCVFTDPDLVPFEPPERPLGLLGLRTLMRNYIETVPRSAYDQTVTHFRTRMSDVLIVADPDVIQEILVGKADAFGRDPTTRRSFAPVIGNTSLFLAEGAEWRWQRRAVAPI